jgi:CubicO group peptidase (beta-lactamase class C family)
MRSKIGRYTLIPLAVLGGVVVLLLAVAMLAYPPQYVLRVLLWQESDAFDWQKFPARELQPAPVAFHFESASDPRVAQVLAEAAGVPDWEGFLDETETQAFIVIQDGRVLYENYFNNTQRDSIVTSFSVAKSFASTLVGMAIEEGFIDSVNDPVTKYLPELAERDPRFTAITLRHLLLMASGLNYVEMRPNILEGDDPLTTYYPDQRELALTHTEIAEDPGMHFNYNKYHPQLLGMVLERATGMPVTEYMQTRLWDRIGMEYAGSWSLDSDSSGFEKMETGVNARAIDFAKLGQLFLDGGKWEGEQVLSADWVQESTSPDDLPGDAGYYRGRLDDMPGAPYYKYMWWGFDRGGGQYDFSAEGDKGQLIYVSPQARMVIIRNGINYGIPWYEWPRIFYQFASEY